MGMSTEEVELEDLDYLFRFAERLYVIRASINAGSEISEEDYSVLSEVHRVMKEGRPPFYKVVSTDSPVTTTEGSLFDTANSSVT
jgi:hypothetical protein